MPSRVIRGEINASDSLSQVSPEAELAFRALLLAVDDYGRTDARPAALKAALFPMRESFTPKKVRALIEELAALPDAPVCLYRANGREYLHLPNWEKHRGGGRRAAESKFPEPPACTAEEILGDPRKASEILPRDEGRGTSSEGRGTDAAPPGAPPKPAREKAEVSEAAKTLTRGFLDSIRAPFPAFKAPSASAYAAWELEMDRLIRLDARPPAAVVELVQWLFDPTERASPDALFWRPNVLSVPKFRERWDQLQAARARRSHNGERTAPGIDRLGAAAERIQERFRTHLRERETGGA